MNTKHPKPNTPEEIAAINAVIQDPNQDVWIYYNSLRNIINDESDASGNGWCRYKSRGTVLLNENDMNHLRHQLETPEGWVEYDF